MKRRAVGRAAWPPAFVRGLGAAALVAALSCRPAAETTPEAPRTVTPIDPPAAADSAGRPLRALSDVLRDHAPRLMALPGVVGVAEAALPDGRPCLRIYVERLTPELAAELPRTLEGWPVDVEESGAFQAMPDSTTDAAKDDAR